MKKVILSLLVLSLLLCTSCKLVGENLSDVGDKAETKASIAARELENYFIDNFTEEDTGILVDVTKDNIVELITIKMSDNRIIGNVYTYKDQTVKMIEEKRGGTSHADIFFNWYLLKEDDFYYLVEENQGMWQGLGKCDVIIYSLNDNGERDIKQNISVSSKNGDFVDEGEFRKYVEDISAVIEKSYAIRKTLSESKREPLSMDGSFVINTAAQPENNALLKLGKYTTKLDYSDDIYAVLELKEGNCFTLEANFGLDDFKTKALFVKDGYYKIQNKNNINWITLYIYNEEYQTYAIVDDHTFHDQAIEFRLEK